MPCDCIDCRAEDNGRTREQQRVVEREAIQEEPTIFKVHSYVVDSYDFGFNMVAVNGVTNSLRITIENYSYFRAIDKESQREVLETGLRTSALRTGWTDPDSMLSEGVTFSSLIDKLQEKIDIYFIPCPHCGMVHNRHRSLDRHGSCIECETLHLTEYLYMVGREGICQRCRNDNPNWLDDSFPGHRECMDCGAIDVEDEMEWLSDNSDDCLCTDCICNLETCPFCEEFIYPNQSSMYRSVLGQVHRECNSDDSIGNIRNWDFKPDLIFNPDLPLDPKQPLYIGMELEVSQKSRQLGRTLIFLGSLPELFYAKQDSSVTNGFEIVTHPMQPKWALENFPFNLFDQAIQENIFHATHASAGTHIHMNKDAFTSSHLWKF